MKKKLGLIKTLLIILIFVISINVLATDQKEIDHKFMRSQIEEFHIDSNNTAGRFLIYDCLKKHYACVNDVSFERCEVLRKNDLDNKALNLTCAPIGKYDNKEICVLKNYELQKRNILKKFCFYKY